MKKKTVCANHDITERNLFSQSDHTIASDFK